MSTWSLQTLLSTLHDDIERRLAHARTTLQHPGVKGDASENIWRELLSTYLPKRYAVATAHVVDSKGTFSEQIDVVIFDRQYSPFVFSFEGQLVIPAESVYAVFEAKQALNGDLLKYARDKAASVRQLHRTSMPVPHVGGTSAPKQPSRILGGILALDSDWSPALGQPFETALNAGDDLRKLDIGCCASHGAFWSSDQGGYEILRGGKPATAFLLELIARLQTMATVPMMDVRAYAAWLAK
jgi:hypothetical protein